METEKKLVLITGISGYLGSSILNEFLCGEGKGKYRIRGTVRDSKNEAKIKPIRDFIGDAFDQVELVSAELLDQPSIDKAVEGCDFVVHTASPVIPENPQIKDNFVKPAVDGTKYVVEAAAKYKVKRVVITSSVAAVGGFMSATGGTFDESDWTDAGVCPSAYLISKTLAEKFAWDFLESKTKAGEFSPEIVTICPSVVLGEISHAAASSSLTFVKRAIDNKMIPMLQAYLPFADVKDVTKAHIRGMERPDAVNKRFIISMEEPLFGTEMFQCVKQGLEENGYAPEITCDDMTIPETAAKMIYKNQRSREILGIEYKRSQKEIITVSALDLIKHKVCDVKGNA